eukprot:86446_1
MQAVDANASANEEDESLPDPVKCILSAVSEAIQNSVLIRSLGIPSAISNVIASYYPAKRFDLKMDRSMVEYCSAEDYGDHYSLEKLFIQSSAYCTKAKTEVEILIKLSSKNHEDDAVDLEFEQFVITNVSIEAPGAFYSAPVETFMMWTFEDSVPTSTCIQDQYSGRNMEQLPNENCCVVLENIHLPFTIYHNKEMNRTLKKSKYLFDASNWIRAKYILIKLMATKINVDTKRPR